MRPVPQDQSGADNDDILDDVLPFQCGDEWNMLKSGGRIQYERSKRSDHMEPEQYHDRSEQPSRDKPDPQNRFPYRQDKNGGPRVDDPKAKRLYGVSRQRLRGTESLH